MAFINPYNFVPFGTREKSEDREGPRHDEFGTGLYSGTIPITITVKTPLLLLDQSNHDGTKQDSLPVRLGPDGRPLLAASSVKGMLRAAFEAVTSSRMGVFNGKRRIAMREAATAAQKKRPAHVVVDGDPASRRLTIVESLKFTRDGEVQQLTAMRRGQPVNVDPLPTLLVPSELVRDHKDGDRLEAWALLVKHFRGNQYWAWRVQEVGTPGQVRREKPDQRNHATSATYHVPAGTEPQWIRVSGILHKTGRTLTNKHDEHLVVTEVLDGPATLERRRPHVIDGSIDDMWQAVLEGYRDAEDQNLPVPHNLQRGSYAQRTPEEMKRWDLTTGRTCFVELDREGNVVGISPVLIGRKPFPKAPRDLVPPETLPSGDFTKLSPADRVFGWVPEERTTVEPSAYLGNLRLEPCICTTDKEPIKDFTEPVQLAPLQSPKPTQFRFYVGQANGDALDPGRDKDVRNGYADGKALRGRKVYPHHRGRQEGYWNAPPQPEVVREWVAPTDVNESQTRWIEGWVKPGTTFTTTLHVQNLSASELGALLALLTLPKDHHHRLGLGKPLGFGSVYVSCDLSAVRISDGQQLAEWYRSPSAEPVRTREEQLEGMKDEWLSPARERPAWKAWCQAAVGFKEPIHYPRTTRDPQPEGYTWFVENEKVRARLGHNGTRKGHRAALPILREGHVPMLPYEPYQDTWP